MKMKDFIEPDFYKVFPVFFASMVVTVFLIIVSIIIGLRVKRLKEGEQPRGFLFLIVLGVKKFNQFVKSNVGKKWTHVAPMTLTLAMYIFLANISGLFLLDTPTASLTITLPLALFSIITIQSTGIVSRKWKHIKTWFEPMPFLFPLNVISDFTPIISLSLRLFGNVASGAVLLGIVYGFAGYVSPIIAAPLHIVFDIGFGLIQTLVFVLLTILFASNKVESSDLDFEL